MLYFAITALAWFISMSVIIFRNKEIDIVGCGFEFVILAIIWPAVITVVFAAVVIYILFLPVRWLRDCIKKREET